MKIKGIKYISPTFDGSGYGQASRGYILALHKLGIPITLAPVSFEKTKPDHGKYGDTLRSLVDKKIDYDVVIIHTTPEFYSRLREEGKTNIAYTIWETDSLHKDWPKYINDSVDKVLVGSKWNKGIFKHSGVTIPVGVVPHGIEVSEFDGIEPYGISGVSDDAYVFYDIFQWTERKNPMDLIKAYWFAFQNDEDVVLVLKTYRSDYSDKEKDVIRNTLKGLKRIMPMDKYPKIYLIPNMLSRDEILGLHKRGNCFVSLDRGEGFGLPGFEAGTVGNPIIITGFGGATEYAKTDNSYLVDYQPTPVFGMIWSPWYRGDQCWAEPNVIHGAERMKHVYNNQKEAEEVGNTLKKDIEKKFSWKKVGKRMIKEIGMVEG